MKGNLSPGPAVAAVAPVELDNATGKQRGAKQKQNNSKLKLEAEAI